MGRLSRFASKEDEHAATSAIHFRGADSCAVGWRSGAGVRSAATARARVLHDAQPATALRLPARAGAVAAALLLLPLLLLPPQLLAAELAHVAGAEGTPVRPAASVHGLPRV